MANCNDKPTHCAPCGDCPPAPDPILPRCNNALTNGVYTNATVTVTGGCITNLAPGEPFAYQPQTCCGGGGGGGEGPVGPAGPAGPAGAAATITVSATNTLPPGSPASVQNIGTPQAVNLVFNIPEGQPGGGGGGGGGLTFSGGGWTFSNGLVQVIPPLWPPAVNFDGDTDLATISLTGSIDNTGTLSVTLAGLSLFKSMLESTMDSKDSVVESALQSQIDSILNRLDALEQTVAGCCSP